MRVGLYTPYLNIAGGGERYIFTIAEYLSRNNEVDIILDKKMLGRDIAGLRNNIRKIFNLDLSLVDFIPGPFGSGNFLERFVFTRKYDLFFYLTDGSLFFCGAKKSIIHIQVPLRSGPKGFPDRLKLLFWPIKVCNSEFTKKWVEKNWRIKVNFVHYGCFDPELFRPLPKENLILTVGRFDECRLHNKKHQVMIDTFKTMCDNGLLGWRLVIVGSLTEENKGIIIQLDKIIRGYPIELKFNLPFKNLTDLYGRAKIYWHAAGFGVDENQFPEKVEHLGLSTVEAMAAGAVPVVIRKGGQKETVKDGFNGFLWETIMEFREKTEKVIKEENLWQELSKNALLSAQNFTKDKFCQKLEEIISA